MRCCAVVLVVVLLAQPARAEDEAAQMSPAARAHYDRGAELSTTKRYEDAIREFMAAYELEPRREFLFAWAQVERLSGDCESAIALYQKFLDTTPPENQAEAARLNLDRCKQALGPRPPAVPAAPPPAAAPTTTVIVKAPAPPVATSTKILLAVGAGVAGAGATLFFLSYFDERAAPRAARYEDYLDRMDRARLERTLSYVGLGLGAALGGVGLVRLANERRAHETAGVGAGAVLGLWTPGDGGGLAARGWF